MQILFKRVGHVGHLNFFNVHIKADSEKFNSKFYMKI